MADSETHILKGIRLLSHLDEAERFKLERGLAWKRYAPQEQIIDRQSETRHIFFVVKGSVRVVNYSLSGREITLNDINEGGHFGDLACIDSQPRSASVMALTDCLIAAVPSDQFLAIVEKVPALALALMRSLSQIVRNATDRIMDLSTLAANNRVHAELLRQARTAGIADNTSEIRPIPVHGDIASRVSTTRETVARVMNELARQGIVERQKDVLAIHDVDRLRDMVEEVRGE